MKRKAILLFLFMMIMISFTAPIQAKAKIKINKKYASIYVGKTVKLKIKGTKKKVKWKSYNKKIATVSSKGLVRGKKQGVVTITGTVKGKKYKCTVFVRNKTSTASGAPYYLSNYIVNKYSNDNNQYTIQFTLLDYNKNEITNASGNVKIYITNNKGENVYNKTLAFSRANYFKSNGGTYYYYIRFPSSDIRPGSTSNGTIHVVVTGNGVTFKEMTNSVSELPLKPLTDIVKIKLPSVPCTFNNLDYNNTIEQTYVISNIRYTVSESYNNTYTVAVSLDGQKTYDARGNNQGSYMYVSYRLKRGDVVVKSGTIMTVSLFTGEKFVNQTENIYDVPAGEYTLQIVNTN